MSRYLEYISREPPPQILNLPPQKPWPFCLRGPEEKFRVYLAGTDYGGSNWICGGGRFAVGQVNLVWTTLATFGPGIYYFAVVLPDGVPNRDLFRSFWGWLQSVLAAIIVVCFFCSALLNPGVVPRQRGWRDFDNDNRTQPLPRYLVINGVTIIQKFCNTCKIFRPPRSKHCQMCDNCVLRFDHHCPFVGNCIGLHNYRYFLVLINSASLFLFITIGMTLHVLYLEFGQINSVVNPFARFVWTLAYNPFKDVFLVYSVFLLLAVLILSMYHSFIVFQNLTTNEHVKKYYEQDNPFDFGPSRNAKQVLCYPDRVLAQGTDVIEILNHPPSDYNGDGGSLDDM
jgi:palmitoyltransferase ZDHHC9/14/18